MEAVMTEHTISRLAKLAGVSVRTLHHYDHIGLLQPSARTAAGYRLYTEPDLLRLQQILFFKELDFSLDAIQTALNDPHFDPAATLKNHRRLLQLRADRLGCLLNTLDKTITQLTEDMMTLTDAELYEGFTKEQVDRYNREVNETYDPALVAESRQRVRKLSKEQWAGVKAEGENVTRLIAAHMDHTPGSPPVQTLIARHCAWIENFYPVSAEIYAGLGQLYIQNQEFTAHYEQYRPGMADFMAKAMAHYADTVLAKK
jgi:DNA-binding transcriptional MerR regulator